MNLCEFLKIKAEKYGKKPFLINRETTVTYREFDEITDMIANDLSRSGIKKGDHVAVIHPNSLQVLLAYFAIIKTGGVVVPINSDYSSKEIAFILNNSDSSTVIVHEDFVNFLQEIKNDLSVVRKIIIRKRSEGIESAIKRAVSSTLKNIKGKDCELDDPAIIFYTSGTTGRPKGVILSHRNFCFGGPNISQNYGLTEDDITIAVLPMVHVFSIASPFFGSLSSGGAVVILQRFNSEHVLKCMQEHKITWFPGVPTMFIYLLNAMVQSSYDFPYLRMGLSGGASLPVEILRNWEKVFQASIIEVYGLTESTGLVTANPVYGVRKLGSTGISVSGVDVRIVDKQRNEIKRGKVGELIFRGPNATKGYYKLPWESKEKIRDGWIYTGDHAQQDAEGYFYIVGREKELIISGGFNIYPKEIEDVIHRFPGINEAAVIGIPDRNLGEVPKAFFTIKEGSLISEEKLLKFCKENLARYKIPKFELMKELPKNSTGKILKKELSRY